jgi:GDP/UDP-N,N'-diacetylbacillosamine 2-epimerase (hydrolysing)
MKKICIFTGTRAEYGILKNFMSHISEDRDLQLQIIASSMHLSPEFGNTYEEIVADGFEIDEKVETLLSSDTAVGIAKSMGLGLIGYCETLQRLKPDIVVILGDRFEAFAMAAATVVCRLPIAHLHGGELTFGVADETFRHAITKMSHLHFTSTEEYRQRVIQLGEQPERVFNVGALGVENIKRMKFLDREILGERIHFNLHPAFALVTYHPVTLEHQTAQEQVSDLLNALDKFPELNLIFTKANADADGRIINLLIDEYVASNRRRAIAFPSMGQLHYLSALRLCSLVLGNSSSGIIEAPSLGIPTVNIGDRQKGRIRAASVIDCEPTQEDIASAIKRGLSADFKNEIREMENPYEKEGTAANIIRIIKEFKPENTLKKEFFDLPFSAVR